MYPISKVPVLLPKKVQIYHFEHPTLNIHLKDTTGTSQAKFNFPVSSLRIVFREQGWVEGRQRMTREEKEIVIVLWIIFEEL